jgi:hypothetical protein
MSGPILGPIIHGDWQRISDSSETKYEFSVQNERRSSPDLDREFQAALTSYVGMRLAASDNPQTSTKEVTHMTGQQRYALSNPLPKWSQRERDERMNYYHHTFKYDRQTCIELTDADEQDDVDSRIETLYKKYMSLEGEERKNFLNALSAETVEALEKYATSRDNVIRLSIPDASDDEPRSDRSYQRYWCPKDNNDLLSVGEAERAGIDTTNYDIYQQMADNAEIGGWNEKLSAEDREKFSDMFLY